VKISADAAADMVRFANEFGLTAVARSRLAGGVYNSGINAGAVLRLVPSPICIRLPALRRRNTVGRPIGSLNKEKPFKVALQVALRARPQSLRRIADRLIDRAEEGDLPSAREIADRLDGRPVQMIDRRDVVITQLSDEELLLIASGGRIEDGLEIKVIPPPSKD
jgi:hypothetical protein